MVREYKKSFGTFTLEIVKGTDEVRLRASINSEEVFCCRELNVEKKAVVFWTVDTVLIDNKKVKIGGCVLPDFDEVYAEYNKIDKEIKDEIKSLKNNEIEAIKSGEQKIKLSYHDGEYLSGHSVHGLDADLLVKIGIAKYIDGWGYIIDKKVVDVIGTEFAYQDAVDYMKPITAAKEAKKTEQDLIISNIFKTAKETGERQLLHKWSDDCDDKNEECNVDMCYEYAMSDGTVKTERHHTW